MGLMPAAAMTNDQPVLEIVADSDGTPIFQICGLGMCTRHRDFLQCQMHWEAMLVAKGLHPDQFPIQKPAHLDDAAS